MTAPISKRTKNRGQGLVEFALVLPILLMMIFGIIDFGRVLTTYAMASNSLRDALRLAEIIGYQDVGQDPVYIQCDRMWETIKRTFFLGLTDADIQINYLDNDDADPLDGVAIVASCTPGGPNPDPNALRNGDMLHISFNTSIRPLTPLLGRFVPAVTMTFSGQRTIVKNIEMSGQNDAECNQAFEDHLPYAQVPARCDTDYDGLSDQWECQYFEGTNPDPAVPEVTGCGLEDLWQTGLNDPDNDGCNNGCEETRRTEPLGTGSTDTDDDGLSDGDEAYIYFTNPADSDTDNDGLIDGYEVNHGWGDAEPYRYTNPKDATTDGDCLTDGQEANGVDIGGGVIYTSDPTIENTDGEGFDDCQEILHLTNPNLADTDGDTINDGDENTLGTDPNKLDTDDDGVRDDQEGVNGTNPLDDDSDDDGLLDGEEVNGVNVGGVLYKSDPNQPNSDNDSFNDYFEIMTSHTNPKNRDTDGDGLADDYEYQNSDHTCLDPNKADSDPNPDGTFGDGVSDYSELNGYTINGVLITSDPCDWDSDGDGIADGSDTNPISNDSDGDGLADGWENQWFGNATIANPTDDPDGDGCDNACEQTNGTKPVGTGAADTDGDGLTDGQEINGTGNCLLSAPSTYGLCKSNPLAQDTDLDGLLDNVEVSIGTNPKASNSDNDGLTDKYEYDTTYGSGPARKTNPLLADTDGDGLKDGTEVTGTVVNGQNYTSDPTVADSDGDGLSDGQEINGTGSCLTSPSTTGLCKSNPKAADTDGDGLSDPAEIALGTNPASTDSDGDGLSDSTENTATYSGLKTSPKVADTDGDGLNDGAEVNGTVVYGQTYTSTPTIADTDGDGLTDGQEVNGSGSCLLTPRVTQFVSNTYSIVTPDVYGLCKSHPGVQDSDSDGILDNQEVNGYGSNSCNYPLDSQTGVCKTNPLKADTDGDNLSDKAEIEGSVKTNPNVADTDHDGTNDNLEGACAATPPSLAINNITAQEPNEVNVNNAHTVGTKTITFTVTLTCGNAGETVTVLYTTMDGTATDGVGETCKDYDKKQVFSVNPLTLSTGAPTATIDITIYGDEKNEPCDDDGSESFTVVLSSALPSTVSISQATGTATISDN
jgi:hypothetical protein